MILRWWIVMWMSSGLNFSSLPNLFQNRVFLLQVFVLKAARISIEFQITFSSPLKVFRFSSSTNRCCVLIIVSRKFPWKIYEQRKVFSRVKYRQTSENGIKGSERALHGFSKVKCDVKWRSFFFRFSINCYDSISSTMYLFFLLFWEL